ncbi:cob(I)yrinic acid a c-diamide adenosyltransferase [Rufibacter sp. DG15C]|uniref:cob(I)yrinic acid a,c-diamide adenosyltransferase n=1 Tax=Rufibacter sp. DG15C TaxID=1379909 RepID=UPI00078EAEF1|nr:cob(I)yrinic acid a,c-diamide adenosyltransferase [Rufibacter sp. DG15C]AMM50179.1 cob(I)yrinic acid a c-diamide adenosyltransferase [Rufibacter sp. DG15C]
MKIYTKTGDKGETSLIGGTRVKKSHVRIEAYGTVDELNAFIGVVRDQEVNQKRQALFSEIQDRLFTIGSTLATDPGKDTKIQTPDLQEEDIQFLEKEMDALDQNLPPLRNFILPGGHVAVSFCHVARTVCRRAERLSIALQEDSPVDDLIIKYLNRLSDFLFVLSRAISQELGAQEITWKPRI